MKISSTAVPAVSNPNAITTTELRTVFALAAVYGTRMLGLFMILPVFAIYAKQLPDYTPFMVGLAIGIYGFAQALLQIPLGLLSDRIGRKPVIIGGLLIYALGSIVAANAETLHWIVLGRIIQGSGAVAAAIMALTADLTREEVRMQAMAIIGISIGAAFMLSMLLGPILEHWIGVPGIFWLTSGLALVGIAVVVFVVPTPQHSTVHRDAETVPAQFGDVLRNLDLWRANFGIFTLQFLMTSLFLVVPLELSKFGLPSAQHWQVYIPVMIVSIIGIVPLVFMERRGSSMKGLVLTGILLLIGAELALFEWGDDITGLVGALLLYFIAFNLLEAVLPSLVTRLAPASAKGTAMGVFASGQFLGAFSGGLFGGLAHQAFGLHGVFLLGASIATLWLLVAVSMSNPPRLSNQMLRVGTLNTAQAEQLTASLRIIPGIAEAVVIIEDGLAYLKVDKSVLDPDTINDLTPYYSSI